MPPEIHFHLPKSDLQGSAGFLSLHPAATGLLQSFQQDESILASGKFSLALEKEGRSVFGTGGSCSHDLVGGRMGAVKSGQKAEASTSLNDADG